MGRKKKEFENIFAKILEDHNTGEVPAYNSIKWTNSVGRSGIRISPHKKVISRDKIEEEGNVDVWSAKIIIRDYVITNSFIYSLASKATKDQAATLIRSNDASNVHIGAAMIYQFIEDKKKEILEQHLIE